MNLANPYLQQYKKNELETATQEDIFLLLYDAAIGFLNKAKLALDEQDDELFNTSIQNCQNIIIEFMNTLDMDIGGKFAETLFALYRYYNKLLIKASICKNLDNINEVLRHLTNLRKTWKQAIDIYKAEKNKTVKNSEHSISIDAYDSDCDEEYEDEDEDEDNVEISGSVNGVTT